MKVTQYAAVRLKDGREGVAVEVFENGDILVMSDLPRKTGTQ